MKKLFFLVAAALALTAGAAARSMEPATPHMTSHSFEAVDLKETVSMELMPVSKKALRAKRGAVEAKDFLGTYSWKGRNQLSSEPYPNQGKMQIYTDESSGQIMVYNLISRETLKANFDSFSGRLYIPNQYIYTNSSYNQEVWFCNYSAYNTGEAYYPIEAGDAHQFYFTLTEDGGLAAGNLNSEKWENHTYTDTELLNDFCVAAVMMPANNSFFFLCAFITGERVHSFEFDANEWNRIGEATFIDAWNRVFWEDYNPNPYDVPVYQNKTKPTVYLLKNPYGPETPYADVNTSTKEGYIVIDISDPECVIIEPTVYSITVDGGDADMVLYNLNLEGYYKFLEYEISEIPDLLKLDNLTPSTYDPTTGIISVRNARFSIDDPFPFQLYAWKNSPTDGYIKLPVVNQQPVKSTITIDYQANGEEKEQKLAQEEDGSYKVSINGLEWFRFTDDASKAAFYVNLYGSSLGMNLPTVTYLETNKPYTYTPWNGDYTITVSADLSSVTVTTSTPKPSSLDIYLPGDFTEWTFKDSNKFTQTGNGQFSYTVPEDITGGWKVGSPIWRYDYGYAGAVNPADIYEFAYNTPNNANIPLYKGDVISITIDTDKYSNPATLSIVRATTGEEEPPIGSDEQETVDIDGVVYTIYPEAGYFMATDGTNAKGNVSLISSTKGLTLRGVAGSAFKGNAQITSISVPEGATTIGAEAFRECLNLQEVQLPSTLNEIGRYAFLGCSYINSFTLPAKVSTIGLGAFQNCTDLETFKFNQAAISEIPDALFEGCERL